MRARSWVPPCSAIARISFPDGLIMAAPADPPQAMKPNTELNAFQDRGLTRLLAILLVALNLRGAITCVGPLLKDIQEHFGLNGTAAGLLTSLPLFAFGFLSPYAALLARLGLRYLDGTAWLYLGTALIGCGIAFNNVLLPGLLRRDFPAQLALVTALFTMVMVTCGGLGSGVAIPLADRGGWRISLVSWAVPAVLAIALWMPQLRAHSAPAKAGHHAPVWNRSLAWQV